MVILSNGQRCFWPDRTCLCDWCTGLKVSEPVNEIAIAAAPKLAGGSSHSAHGGGDG